MRPVSSAWRPLLAPSRAAPVAAEREEADREVLTVRTRGFYPFRTALRGPGQLPGLLHTAVEVRASAAHGLATPHPTPLRSLDRPAQTELDKFHI